MSYKYINLINNKIFNIILYVYTSLTYFVKIQFTRKKTITIKLDRVIKKLNQKIPLHGIN